MANFNSDYLIEKMEEQEDMYLTRLSDVRQKNERLMQVTKELYECLLDRIYNPPVLATFEKHPTPREREALDAFTNRDNA